MAALNLEQVQVPAGVTVVTKKSSVIFQKNSRRAILKSRALELTGVYKTIKEVVPFSEEEIARRHLGKIKSYVPKVTDEKRLATILRTVFK